jgi:RNA polymerase sigma factor (sigma-70 family)
MGDNGFDDEWFESFFRDRAARTVRLAFLLGAAQPEEVAQEAFVRVYGALGRLSADADVVAYLNRTVVNEVRSGHRRTTTRERLRPLVPVLATTRPHDAVAEALDLDGVLEQLTVAQRQVLVLHYWADLTVRDVATTTGLPLGTVKSHLRRATARLRTLLEDSDGS